MTDEEVLQSLEEYTKKAIDHQLHTLQSILAHQASVPYLRPYLSGHLPPIDAATFRRLVPLSSYDDYADHIDNMANNPDHPPVISVDPLQCFFYSTGTTTTKPKLIPCFGSGQTTATSYTLQASNATLRKLFPARPEVNKILWFVYAIDGTTTPSGFKITGLSSHVILNKENQVQHLLASPREIIFGKNIEHQIYCHLLCALADPDRIDGIRSNYASDLVRAFGMLESKWEQLCDDLENGFPRPEISDIAMRESVAQLLGGPRVDLSRRMRMICEKQKDWCGIVSKLWPKVRYVNCITTGSMKQYYSKLKYYAGEVTVLGGNYGASECIVGLNLDITQPPEKTRYVMLPTAAYFEFLPFDQDRSSAAAAGEETVDFSGVEEGKMYELAVTTHNGLYRYRLGDIIRVVGFHNSSPLIEFVMRGPKSVYEVTETDLMSAMEGFQLELRNHMGLEILEYSSFLETETIPKQLKVFFEIEKLMFLQEQKLHESVEALKMCYLSLENGLGAAYKGRRYNGDLGPVLVTVVKPGSFDVILQEAIKNGAPASQYKPPKIIRSREIVSFLEASSLVTIS
ncbi:hypothetical protein Tsubulata_019887 [Turnera subulata]|uniref:Uncharacterized protein n=1 Tax=Turnera subulata TaxID=218843 RepID=A0A9Q0F274_9ROSI|nr:hypothetical protein Tsubulata_019887 [Turnera subulata]